VLRMVSPADQSLIASMEVDDIIEAIDGRPTRTLDDLAQGIGNAGQGCEVTVFDKNKSQSVQWIVFPMLAQIPQMRTVAAQAPAVPRLFVVIVAATKDETLGPSVVRSLGELKGFIEGEVSATRYVINEVRGDDCNPTGIIQAIDGLPIGFGDSLLVYYLGHGAYDNRFAMDDPYGGHFLDLPGKDLLRKTVWDHMESLPARLRILVTDACNVKSLADPVGRYELRQRTVTKRAAGPTNAEWLFLGHTGRCDISAASPDQFAWYSPDIGGWFTHCFIETGGNANNWNLLRDRVIPGTQKLYTTKRDEYLSHPATTNAFSITQLNGQSQLTPRFLLSRMTKDMKDPIDPSDHRPTSRTQTVASRIP
jgi:Caspase domain